MTTLAQLQDQSFAQDVAYGQQQSAAEMAGLNGTPIDWIGVGSSVLGKALQPSGAGPSSADSVFGTNMTFDNAGWNVAFPNAAITSASSKNLSQGTPLGTVNKLSWYVFAVFGLLGLAMLQKTKKR